MPRRGASKRYSVSTRSGVESGSGGASWQEESAHAAAQKGDLLTRNVISLSEALALRQATKRKSRLSSASTEGVKMTDVASSLPTGSITGGAGGAGGASS